MKCQDPATVHVWSRLEPGRAEPVQDYRGFQPQLNGRRIAKVGVQRSWGKDPRGEQNRRRVGGITCMRVDMTKDLAAMPRRTVIEVNI